MSDQDQKIGFFSIKTQYPTLYAKISNGETLGYRDTDPSPSQSPKSPQKPLLLLLHGQMSCSLSMELIMAKLSPHMRCVAPCLRGYGYSTYEKEIGSLCDLADDVELLIKEKLKCEKIFLLGFS